MPAIPGVSTAVLVAPDSFKGTFTSGEVAAALATGIEEAGTEVDLCPVADGGEGTLEALREPLRASLETVTASDPLGRPVQAGFGLATSARGAATAAIVEVAAASGLGLVSPGERDAVAASTYGTGELIVAA